MSGKMKSEKILKILLNVSRPLSGPTLLTTSSLWDPNRTFQAKMRIQGTVKKWRENGTYSSYKLQQKRSVCLL